MSHNLGADELRIAHILRQQGVGPDAHPTHNKPTTHTPTRKTSPRLPDWWQTKPDISPNSIDEPEPAQRPRDWLDDILEADTTPSGPQPIGPVTKTKPAPEPPPEAKPKQQTKPKWRTWPRPTRHAEEHGPRLSLLEAWDRAPRRLKWLAYHATAAAAGWWLGWVDWSTSTAAWYAAGHWTAPSAWVLYALGVLAVSLYQRTRGWALPAAWAAAIPVSSVVVGVLLYGTGA